jgi:hypothetical protein
MNKAIVRITYRQSINVQSTGTFERDVWEESYQEFLMQSQAYHEGGTLRSFLEMTEKNPKANSLHYKTGFSVGLFIKGLKNRTPDLTDTMNRGLRFVDYRFEILASDILEKEKHEVAIYYTTESFILHDVIGDNLLLAPIGGENYTGEECFLLKLQANLSISSYQAAGQNQLVLAHQ